jgi:uncharacterized protein YhaN
MDQAQVNVRDQKASQQADQSITKLNRAISLFEKDLERIRSEGDKVIASFEERLRQLALSCEIQTENILKVGKEQIAELLMVVPRSCEEQRKNLDAFIDTRTREFTNEAFELYKRGLEEKRKESVVELDKAFQTDIEGLFKKYENRLAPLLFKMLWRYIFHFGK